MNPQSADATHEDQDPRRVYHRHSNIGDGQMPTDFTSTNHQRGIRLALLAALLLPPQIAAAAPTTAEAFAEQNEAAMGRMMAAMHIPSSGDVDTDFVNMMEPHHQGAIDMAMLQLRYGRNPVLRRIAQEIIVGQRQEIDAMRQAIGRPPLPATPVPTQQPAHRHQAPKP